MSKLKESGLQIQDIKAALAVGVTLGELRELIIDPGTDAAGLAQAVLEMARRNGDTKSVEPDHVEPGPKLLFGA